MKIYKIVKYIVKILLDYSFPSRLFINNYYNTNYKKNILISYVIAPFKDKKYLHSKKFEAIQINKIFKSLGYNIDIIQYNSSIKGMPKNKKYDLIFGLEPNFIKSIKKYHPYKSIYYATGSHYLFQNNQEKKRLNNLEMRKQVKLKQIRYVKPHNSSSIADGVILIGNEYTKKTYNGYAKQIETINVTAHNCFSYKEITNNKNYIKSKSNFLWFGSNGAIHKGLDLLLEIFSKNKNINLYVCGGILDERGFINLYYNELFNTENIKFIGWIEPKSNKFKEICSKCCFSILPSCSEGMAGSIASTMFGGLIPIVSKETGITINNKYGIELKDNSIESIEKIILKSINIKSKELKNMSKNAYEYAKEEFTIKKFESNFKKALNNLNIK